MVPPGTSLEVNEKAYANMTTIFAPEYKNKEGFDRRGRGVGEFDDESPSWNWYGRDVTRILNLHGAR
ncbi:hypothetical protein GGS20DRAFT_583875 [Poronia punctata]|nr:hypothetical protein GGS20DRAFT_583875 [Poronia punctata]